MSDFELVHAYDTVNLARAGAAARVELNRPERLNAWNTQLGVDLLAALERARDDEEIRAVMITGAGRAFSSGADLAGDMQVTPSGEPDLYARLTGLYHPVIAAVRFMDKPVVAAVQGAAAGIGCSLALACDLIVAAEQAYFLLAFVNIGLVPDGGSSMFVPNRAGLARATELAMLGERLPAPRALEWGLINRVVDAAELESAAGELTARLAAGPTRAYAGAKRALNAWTYRGWHEQLELEATIQQEAAGSADFREGALAFLQKRPASFTGR